MFNDASQKPYLIRALWEWCIDQGHTPHIAVMINEHTRIPQGYDDNGQIVLDISTEATQGLEMTNDWISFQARFGVNAHQIDIPVGQIVAIFASETGQGMGFEVSTAAQSEHASANEHESNDSAQPKVSPLKIVK